MDIKPFAFAVAGAVAGALGTGVLKSRAAGTPVDLFDSSQVDSSRFQAWRDNALKACDAVRATIDAAEKLHAAAGMTATLVSKGHYVISRGTSAGSISVDMLVAQPDDAGAGDAK